MFRFARLAPLAAVALAAALPAPAGATAASAPASAAQLPRVAPPTDAIVQGLARTTPHRRGPVVKRARRRISMQRPGMARASSFSDAWFGSGAACVGTSVALSVGRDFGLAPGTYFSWRARMLVYNPRTGAENWSAWSGLYYDRVSTTSYMLPDGTFVMGNTGVDPSPVPTSAWSIQRGLWVSPYVEVTGYGTHPVNFGYVPAPDSFAQPNWCYIA
jgi:hypothetical protein